MAFTICSLTVQNFRGFEDQRFQFDSQFSAVVGNNGTGKTAVLDATAVCLNRIIKRSRLPKSTEFDAMDSDVRRVTYRKGKQLHTELQSPMVLSLGIVFDIPHKITYAFPPSQERANTLLEYSRLLLSRISQGSDEVLPLFAYYRSRRRWNDAVSPALATPTSRTEGWHQWQDASLSLGDLLEWMKTRELVQLQENEPDELLEIVKGAVASCVEGAVGLEYNIRQGELLVELENGGTFPFRMLSDGQKNMSAMAADIAWRAGTLNPQLGKDVLTKTPGTVLIDEIDLHLHPRWQRRVVADLCRTFPALQFVVSTHSPFIIQSLRPGQLVDLNAGEPAEYAGQSIEDIAEEIMGIDIPQRSQRHREMVRTAERYYQLIEQGRSAKEPEVAAIKQQLDELLIPFSDDPAYTALLQTKRIAAGLGNAKGSEA